MFALFNSILTNNGSFVENCSQRSEVLYLMVFFRTSFIILLCVYEFRNLFSVVSEIKLLQNLHSRESLRSHQACFRGGYIFKYSTKRGLQIQCCSGINLQLYFHKVLYFLFSSRDQYSFCILHQRERALQLFMLNFSNARIDIRLRSSILEIVPEVAALAHFASSGVFRAILWRKWSTRAISWACKLLILWNQGQVICLLPPSWSSANDIQQKWNQNILFKHGWELCYYQSSPWSLICSSQIRITQTLENRDVHLHPD